jgi:hypothetical protein
MRQICTRLEFLIGHNSGPAYQLPLSRETLDSSRYPFLSLNASEKLAFFRIGAKGFGDQEPLIS